MHTRHFAVNAFASDTNQAFVKDEIRGDGTSGLYHLSRKNIVVNSDKIVIEVRDRFRSEIVISSQPLSRFVDYDIDYDTGAILFKKPITSKDENFNPVYIVVDYESDDGGKDKSYTYGGRAAVKTADDRVEAGATAIHEGQTGGSGNLYGLDATWKVTDSTEVHAEAATSKSASEGEDHNGNAWLAEVTHRSSRLAGNVYYREQQQGFGLGQQSATETGTRKMGMTGDWQMTDAWGVTGQAYRQYNLETGGIQDMAETAVNYTKERYSLLAGLRQVSERTDGQSTHSTQLTLGGSWKTLGDRLTLRTSYDQSLAGSNSSADYPTRLDLGADYQLTRSVTLTADQEFTWGDKESTQGTRLGMRTTPWKGGEVSSSVEQDLDENGARIFANLGLKQTWQVTDHLSLDGSLDRSQTLKHPGNASFNTNVPSASGFTEDFTAVSVGANYKEKNWAWANRLEYRTADSGDKWGLFSGIVGEVRPGLGMSARGELFLTDSSGSGTETDSDLRLGLAYRPDRGHWIVLDRLDYIFQKTTGDLPLTTWRLVNNLNANFRPASRTQISLQYGAKYVQDRIDDDILQRLHRPHRHRGALRSHRALGHRPQRQRPPLLERGADRLLQRRQRRLQRGQERLGQPRIQLRGLPGRGLLRRQLHRPGPLRQIPRQVRSGLRPRRGEVS